MILHHCDNFHWNWGFIFYYGSRNRKLSLSSKLHTDSLCRCDVKFCLQKKTQRICKMASKEYKKILIKNIATRRGMVWRDCLQSSPTNVGHSQLWSFCSRRSMTSEQSTDNFAVEENKKLLLNKNTVLFQ